MKTPNETRTPRAGFWLRVIEHRKNELARDYRRTLGVTAREGISDEDYATTMATLEKMARNLGWDESQRPERRRGFRHGARHHGMMHGHGFGSRHPFDDRRTETPEA